MAHAIPTCHHDESALATRPARYALHDAAERADAALLTRLLTAPPIDDDADAEIMDVNEKDPAGCTPLHVAVLAAAGGSTIPLLLAHGAGVKTRCNGSPPLHALLSMGAIPANGAFVTATLATLLALKDDVTASLDDTGQSWLHVVARLDQAPAADAIAAAISRKAAAHTSFTRPPPRLDVDATDKRGRTPLHAAAAGKAGGMLAWLLARGAQPGVADAAGDTPALVAARVGWGEGLRTLTSGAAASRHTLTDAGRVGGGGEGGHESGVLGGVGGSEGASAASLLTAGGISGASLFNHAGETAAGILAAVLGPVGGSAVAPVAGSSSSSSAGGGVCGTSTALITHEVCWEHHTCEPINRCVQASNGSSTL